MQWFFWTFCFALRIGTSGTESFSSIWLALFLTWYCKILPNFRTTSRHNDKIHMWLKIYMCFIKGTLLHIWTSSYWWWTVRFSSDTEVWTFVSFMQLNCNKLIEVLLQITGRCVTKFISNPKIACLLFI